MSRLFVKLDVDFWDHPKVIKAGEGAAVLYLRMLAWSKKHLTDGYVPAEVVQTLCRVRAAEKQRKLHGAALIEQSSCSGGWQIVGWADDNRSRAEVEEIRSKRRSAGRRGAENRWQTDSNLPSVCHDDAMASCHDHEHAQSTEHIAHSSELPTSVVTESNRVPGEAASDGDDTATLWRAAGITRPEPTTGDRKTVAAAIRRGWTMAQLTERAATASASGNPRAYLVAVLSSPAPTQPRPDPPRPVLDDERQECEPCGASGWVDAEDGVMPCPACTVGARP